MLDRLPFWKRYFAELGIETVLSPVTDPRISAAGIELAVAQPCYPGAGGARPRAGAGRARAWTTSCCPVMADAEAGDDGCASHYCPWNQTLPWVLRSAPGLEPHAAQVPDSDAALPAGPGAGEEGAGRDHARASA